MHGAADAARPCSQVGDVNADHSAWGRAEDMTMPRPSYSVNPNNPGAPWAGAGSHLLPVDPCAPPARTYFPGSTFCKFDLFVASRQMWLVKPYPTLPYHTLPYPTYHTLPSHMLCMRPGSGACAGSDLLGQCSAALAAISIVFEKTDPPYALQLVAHARDLYACAPTRAPGVLLRCGRGARP